MLVWSDMNKSDITHLAHLSRIALSEEEISEYITQFDEIMLYVDKIKESHDEEGSQIIESNQIQNVLRDDVACSYKNPEVIINEAPHHQDNFVKVKKILNQ